MIGHAPTSRRGRRSVSILALLGLVLALFVPSVAAQADDTDPAVIVANSIDATSSPTEVIVLADSYRFGADRVSVVENGEELAVDSVERATVAGRPLEMIYVIDTSNRNARGDVLAKVQAEVAAAIRALPAGTLVSVVDAGDSAVVRAFPTEDLESAAQAVERLDMSSGASLFNALDRAASLVDVGAGRIGTVVLFAGGEDVGSEATVAAVENALSRAEVQLITVRYNGGEAALQKAVTVTGGFELGATGPEDISSVMAAALSAGADRMIIRYPGNIETNVRNITEVSIGAETIAFSHPGGVALTKPVSFPTTEIVEPSGFAFFRSDVGLYLAIGLAFVGIGLAIFSLGSVFAGGDASLDRLIARYSGETIGDELDDEESQIVQTALVRRAVEMSESFAEDRGFLTKVEEMLERAKVPLRAGEAMSFWTVITLVSGAVGMLLAGGLIGGLILAVIGAFMQIFVLRFKAQRRMRKFEQQLPDTLQLLAGTLRAGYSLPQGLEAVSHESADPMGFELRRVMTEARLGREMEEALAAAAERLSSPDFAWAVMAISIQREVGGNLNELLMTVSDTMIARERLKGEVAALTAEGRASAILLGGLPPGLGFVMWLMNREYIELLFTETLGKIMLVAAFVMMTIGMTWMRKVMQINV